MATCPECDAEIEVDEFDVDKGDLISCPECGSNLEVTSTSPVELEAVDEDDDDDDEDDDDDDEATRTTTSKSTTTTRRRRRGERGGLGRVTHALTAADPAGPRAARRRPSCSSQRIQRAGPARRPGRLACADRRLQRRRRQRLPRLGGDAGARPRALCITADSPSYPERHRALALPDCRRVRPRPRSHPHRRDGAARVPRQSREPLLLLQARALHAPGGDRARARHSGHRRRQQCRRPWRLPSGPAGGA